MKKVKDFLSENNLKPYASNILHAIKQTGIKTAIVIMKTRRAYRIEQSEADKLIKPKTIMVQIDNVLSDNCEFLDSVYFDVTDISTIELIGDGLKTEV